MHGWEATSTISAVWHATVSPAPELSLPGAGRNYAPGVGGTSGPMARLCEETDVLGRRCPFRHW